MQTISFQNRLERVTFSKLTFLLAFMWKIIVNTVMVLMLLFVFQIHRRYCDDERNTDNSWVETIACNFHDDTGKILDKINLKERKQFQFAEWISTVYAIHFSFGEK